MSYNLHLCKTCAGAPEEPGSPEQRFCSLTSNSQEQVGYTHRNIDELPRPGNKHGTAASSLGEARVRILAGGHGCPLGSESQTSTHSTERNPVLCALDREDF